MRGWNPLCFTLCVFAGAPAAGLDDAVLSAAAEGQVVDVGASAGGIPGDVMDLAVVAGHGAARSRTPTVLGVQHDPLCRGSQSFCVIERQRFALVEDRQIMPGVAGQTARVTYG